MWTDASAQPKQQKRDMRFGTWNVKSLYGSRLLMTVVRELPRYKFFKKWDGAWTGVI